MVDHRLLRCYRFRFAFRTILANRTAGLPGLEVEFVMSRPSVLQECRSVCESVHNRQCSPFFNCISTFLHTPEARATYTKIGNVKKGKGLTTRFAHLFHVGTLFVLLVFFLASLFHGPGPLRHQNGIINNDKNDRSDSLLNLTESSLIKFKI